MASATAGRRQVDDVAAQRRSAVTVAGLAGLVGGHRQHLASRPVGEVVGQVDVEPQARVAPTRTPSTVTPRLGAMVAERARRRRRSGTPRPAGTATTLVPSSSAVGHERDDARARRARRRSWASGRSAWATTTSVEPACASDGDAVVDRAVEPAARPPEHLRAGALRPLARPRRRRTRRRRAAARRRRRPCSAMRAGQLGPLGRARTPARRRLAARKALTGTRTAARTGECTGGERGPTGPRPVGCGDVPRPRPRRLVGRARHGPDRYDGRRARRQLARSSRRGGRSCPPTARPARLVDRRRGPLARRRRSSRRAASALVEGDRSSRPPCGSPGATSCSRSTRWPTWRPPVVEVRTARRRRSPSRSAGGTWSRRGLPSTVPVEGINAPADSARSCRSATARGPLSRWPATTGPATPARGLPPPAAVVRAGSRRPAGGCDLRLPELAPGRSGRAALCPAARRPASAGRRLAPSSSLSRSWVDSARRSNLAGRRRGRGRLIGRRPAAARDSAGRTPPGWWRPGRCSSGPATAGCGATSSRCAAGCGRRADALDPPRGRWGWPAERRIVVAHPDATTLDLFPAPFPRSWAGQPVEAYGVPVGGDPSVTVGAAVRWHGERPALLWELAGAADRAHELRAGPGVVGTRGRGEALLSLRPAPP